MSNQANVECPNCGTPIDVDDVLRAQVEKNFKIAYEQKLQQERKTLKTQEDKLREFQEKLLHEREILQQTVNDSVAQKIKSQTEIIRSQVTAQLAEENEDQLKTLQQELNTKSQQLKELNQTRAEVEKLKREKTEIRIALEAENQQKLNQLLDVERAKAKSEKEALKAQLRSQLAEENADQLKSLQQELNTKSQQLKELNQTKAEVEKLKREKAEIRAEVELASQRKLTAMLEEERLKLAKSEQERSEMKMAERDKIIADLSNQLKDAQRKAEQGSMQLQGEVQELAIEEWLRSQFPLDTIEEIKKGARGGDCVHVVNTRSYLNCGTIYYESKRTQAWSPAWIEKFKVDMREKGADIGVIVTEAMPKDMDRMGLVDGIWVCTYPEFKGLCKVLRQQILAISQAVSSQENKGDKMEMLYNFLTSNEFKLQIEGIVGAFTTMQSDLLREQRAMSSIWKQRQKQIDKVTDNTIAMYGSIRGIAGSAIPAVPALELPEDDEVGLDSLI